MKITTDHKRRELIDFAGLPEEWQKEFDYIEEDDVYGLRFVKYKGQWYDTYDTQRIVTDMDGIYAMGWHFFVEPGSPLAAWDGIASDSFFSGMVFKFGEDNGYDWVIVGMYCN